MGITQNSCSIKTKRSETLKAGSSAAQEIHLQKSHQQKPTQIQNQVSNTNHNITGIH
jgi:hypothetical protein